MTTVTQVGEAQLADLLKQVQAGNEILLVAGDKPVARLTAVAEVPVQESSSRDPSVLQIRAIEGPRVLIPNFTRAELAEEMFDR
jgi:antitoxin (DNA-binding transcriptional repressor) of toxin-antitoxin stability system